MPSSSSLHLWRRRVESMRQALKTTSDVQTRVLHDMVVFTVATHTDPNLDVRAVLTSHLRCNSRFVAICPPPWFYALDPQGETMIATVRPSHTFLGHSGPAVIAAGLAFTPDSAADDALLVAHVYVFDSEAQATSWQNELLEEQIDQAIRNASACLMEGIRGLESTSDSRQVAISEALNRFVQQSSECSHSVAAGLQAYLSGSKARPRDADPSPDSYPRAMEN